MKLFNVISFDCASDDLSVHMAAIASILSTATDRKSISKSDM